MIDRGSPAKLTFGLGVDIDGLNMILEMDGQVIEHLYGDLNGGGVVGGTPRDQA